MRAGFLSAGARPAVERKVDNGREVAGVPHTGTKKVKVSDATPDLTPVGRTPRHKALPEPTLDVSRFRARGVRGRVEGLRGAPVAR
ncbi:hypothetical protein GCM10029963_66910 [Micromonospora andamanensis]|nr:hypothetical protein Vwe01_05650 [Micromonospora andamanensis]